MSKPRMLRNILFTALGGLLCLLAASAQPAPADGPAPRPSVFIQKHGGDAKRDLRTRPVSLVDLYKPTVAGVDVEWVGRRDATIFIVRGCREPRFDNFEVWAAPTAGVKRAFYLVNSSAKTYGWGASFHHIHVHGTDGGIDTAFYVNGVLNQDNNRWDEVHIARVKRGWVFEGWNAYEQSIEDCHLFGVEVGISAESAIGSFHVSRMGCGLVGTLLKMPSATRASSIQGVGAELCGIIFDVARTAGECTPLSVRDVSWDAPTQRWERDPDRFLIGRFLADDGLVLDNVCTNAGKLPDGRWRAVIEARVPENVVRIGRVEAEIVPWIPPGAPNE